MGLLSLLCLPAPTCRAESSAGVPLDIPAASIANYRESIQPLLRNLCYDCHGDGASKGQVALDGHPSEKALLQDRELWLRVLRNIRAGIMPPAKKPQPSAEQKSHLESWIKGSVFLTDPANLDPGRVTVRRLNRVEYRNTIQELMGIDFDTEKEFPPDDTGHGFDNNGDVLTISPMLLEKYLAAASVIVDRAVPTVSRAPAERVVVGGDFRREDRAPKASASAEPVPMSFYEATRAQADIGDGVEGRFRFVIDLNTTERYVDGQNDYNRARFRLKAGDRTVFEREFNREGNRQFRFEQELQLTALDRGLTVEIEPLSPDQKRIRDLGFRIHSITRIGPLAPEQFVMPAGYRRFFPEDVPSDAVGRERYAHWLLERFASRAFRAPVESGTLDRLVRLALTSDGAAGETFEKGVARAMVAVLASPRFLFREERTEASEERNAHPFVDQYALASRLSYFLWSSMPDETLFQKAAAGVLRRDLAGEVRRMVKDPRSQALVQNFTGQWLQARDIESVSIEARTVLTREAPPDPELDRVRLRVRELRTRDFEALTVDEKKELDALRQVLSKRASQPLRADLHMELRRSMRRETEMAFDHVLRGDRSALELLDADYTFLNESMAQHYGLTNLQVRGPELRRVSLPPDSPRGGLLTQGTVLAVTSNPTRTSPVKRGLFILENILGTPPPPAPPNVPSLEETVQASKEKELTLREALAIHREKPLCSSCHNRMDPPGLALENFNAMGMWREQERGQPIDPAGTLLSGETFSGVRELKRILVTQHRTEFYRTLTEKLMTYALGRGLEFSDVETVDRIVSRMKANDGRLSELVLGVVESAPFQKRRSPGLSEGSGPGHNPPKSEPPK